MGAVGGGGGGLFLQTLQKRLKLGCEEGRLWGAASVAGFASEGGGGSWCGRRDGAVVWLL